MEGKLSYNNVLNISKSVGVALIIGVVIVGIICYIARWRNMEAYFKGITYIGFLYLVFGIFSIKTVMRERGSSLCKDEENISVSYNYSLEFLIIMLCSGAALILISVAFRNII